jgi:hypothetical protein
MCERPSPCSMVGVKRFGARLLDVVAACCSLWKAAVDLLAHLQMRHGNMRRSLLPTEFGPGTGYRTLENTMPIRNLLREQDALLAFRAKGTIEGVDQVVIQTPGLPPKPRILAPPDEPEVLVLETVQIVLPAARHDACSMKHDMVVHDSNRKSNHSPAQQAAEQSPPAACRREVGVNTASARRPGDR